MPKAERLQVWLPGRESGDGERHNGASLPAVPASHKVISRGEASMSGGRILRIQAGVANHGAETGRKHAQ